MRKVIPDGIRLWQKKKTVVFLGLNSTYVCVLAWAAITKEEGEA